MRMPRRQPVIHEDKLRLGKVAFGLAHESINEPLEVRFKSIGKIADREVQRLLLRVGLVVFGNGFCIDGGTKLRVANHADVGSE